MLSTPNSTTNLRINFNYYHYLRMILTVDMKKHLTYILTLILWCVSGVAYAQNTCSITGSVIDSKGEGIPYAAAVVYSGEKIVGGDVADEKGRFRVDVQKTVGRLVLSVEFIGYRKKTIEITALEKSINLGEIVLEEDTQQLGEAVVSASAESHKATLEKTSINASSQMTSSKGSALAASIACRSASSSGVR